MSKIAYAIIYVLSAVLVAVLIAKAADMHLPNIDQILDTLSRLSEP